MNNDERLEKTDDTESVQQCSPMLEKQAELEGHYKSACAQEVLLIEQLKQVQKNRECLASQLDLLRSLAA